MKRIDPDEKLYLMSITESEKLEDGMEIVRFYKEFEKEPLDWNVNDKEKSNGKRFKSKKKWCWT